MKSGRSEVMLDITDDDKFIPGRTRQMRLDALYYDLVTWSTQVGLSLPPPAGAPDAVHSKCGLQKTPCFWNRRAQSPTSIQRRQPPWHERGILVCFATSTERCGSEAPIQSAHCVPRSCCPCWLWDTLVVVRLLLHWITRVLREMVDDGNQLSQLRFHFFEAMEALDGIMSAGPPAPWLPTNQRLAKMDAD